MQEVLSEIKGKAGILKAELERKGFSVEAIYLFGSYAKGCWLKESDIDLAVISKDFSGIKFLERLDIVNEIVWKRKLGNIEILPLTPEEVERGSSVAVRDAKKYWIKLL